MTGGRPLYSNRAAPRLEWVGIRARLFASFILGRSNADMDGGLPRHTSLRDFRTQVGALASHHASQRCHFSVHRGRCCALAGLNFLPRQSVRRKGNFSDLVRRAGYPFTQHQVQTEDGYVLELHRLPRPDSDKVPSPSWSCVRR